MTASKRHEQKRHGRHQKHTRHFLKVYTPYLPLILIISFSIVLSVLSPGQGRKGVLSYATSMSVSQLLQATNQKRIANGLPALKINSKLNSAAQAKANDMVERDYWSHQTPDGKQPWVFIKNAGYSYSTAGENLAYGFNDSAATVQGWMNSPTHKANMLNKSYLEVGFGYKNSANFVNTGEETVIVALYAAPAATKGVATTKPVTKPTGESAAVTSTTKSVDKKPVVKKTTVDSKPVAQTVASTEPVTQTVTKVSAVSGRNLNWIITTLAILAFIGLMALLAKHTYALHKWLKRGERYILKHPVFDLTIVSLIGLLYIASQNIGFIK